jgi:hypothetical protein
MVGGVVPRIANCGLSKNTPLQTQYVVTFHLDNRIDVSHPPCKFLPVFTFLMEMTN